jgi:hypothetical protein
MEEPRELRRERRFDAMVEREDCGWCPGVNGSGVRPDMGGEVR